VGARILRYQSRRLRGRCPNRRALPLRLRRPKRLVWTNEETDDGSVTTATFEEKDGKTHLVLHDLYPSKDALDAALASESTGGWTEQFDQLDVVLASAG
jgi:uncharacterized protein YndB with AHSA1/START domain